jgi:cellulose synthase/poly-beta-1,6-N-acetylglucosamine synthase-like glycosyltransferase
MQEAIQFIPITLYFACLIVLTTYGMHRYWQVFLYYRNCKKLPGNPTEFHVLPRVTVQLPLFNERYVTQRVITAVCAMDYPRELLQIQILDDSTDDSARIARLVCEQFREKGFNIELIHRKDRTGFKAGALENGLAGASGEFIAIFDADFVPRPNMLREVIHEFTDETIGCVQTRWAHLNRTQSMLTRAQAIFLDGHFVIEHTARSRSGRFINFNGTGGVWRKVAIFDAGGWQHDTLTEDMDLSYRAQLKGWRIKYLGDVISPAELPPEITAFKQQQHRWTKGSIQTAVKLLPTVLRSTQPLKVKIEAFFHLTSGVVYPLAVLVAVLFFPAFCFAGAGVLSAHYPLIWSAMSMLLTVLTFSAGTFYVVAQKEIKENYLAGILLVPFLMAIGMGMSLANAIAVIEGLLGHQSEFVRTPKYGVGVNESPGQWKLRAGAFKHKAQWIPFAELAVGIYLLACVMIALWFNRAASCVPFMLIFMFGYLYVGSLSLHQLWLSRRGVNAENLEILTPAAVV